MDGVRKEGVNVHLLAANGKGAVCGGAQSDESDEIVSVRAGAVNCRDCLARRRPARDIVDLAWYRATRTQNTRGNRGKDGPK